MLGQPPPVIGLLGKRSFRSIDSFRIIRFFVHECRPRIPKLKAGTRIRGEISLDNFLVRSFGWSIATPLSHTYRQFSKKSNKGEFKFYSFRHSSSCEWTSNRSFQSNLVFSAFSIRSEVDALNPSLIFILWDPLSSVMRNTFRGLSSIRSNCFVVITLDQSPSYLLISRWEKLLSNGGNAVETLTQELFSVQCFEKVSCTTIEHDRVFRRQVYRCWRCGTLHEIFRLSQCQKRPGIHSVALSRSLCGPTKIRPEWMNWTWRKSTYSSGRIANRRK
jgi:hypothetical protein